MEGCMVAWKSELCALYSGSDDVYGMYGQAKVGSVERRLWVVDYEKEGGADKPDIKTNGMGDLGDIRSSDQI